MKKGIFIFFLLVCGFGFLQSQDIPTMKPNTVVDGKKEGQWVIWFTKDWSPTQVKDSVAYFRKISYKNGVPDGKVFDYYLSGRLQWEGFLISDNPDLNKGHNIWYYENGNKSRECDFFEGKEDGVSINFFENGKIKESYFYKTGLLNGQALSFHENGRIAIQGEFESGLEKGIWSIYNENGDIENIIDQTPNWEELISHSDLLYNLGFLNEAIVFIEKAANHAQKETGKYNDKFIVSNNRRAELFMFKGEYSTALQILSENQLIIENQFGIENDYYCQCLLSQGECFRKIGQYEKALIFSMQCKEIVEKKFSNENPLYLKTLNNIGTLYSEMGQYNDALIFLTKAKEIIKKYFETDILSYGVIINNIASVFQNLGELDKALTLYIESLNIVEKHFGKNHNEYCLRLMNLASLYFDLGQFDNALLKWEEALKIVENSFGSQHSYYGKIINGLASTYFSTGQYDKALQFYFEALENTERSQGKNHPDYGNRLSNLGSLYEETGQYDKALKSYLEALENTERSLGKNHPDYGNILSKLGFLYNKTGQYEKALQLNLEALQNTERSLGKNHPDYGNRLSKLGSLYNKTGQYDKALQFYLEALEVIGKCLGKKHIDYITILYNLAGFYVVIGQDDKALQIYQEVLLIVETTLGRKHNFYGDILNNIGIIYLNQGQYEKALFFLEDAKLNIERSVGKNHFSYNICCSNIANTYSEMGNYKNAIIIYKELLMNIQQKFDYEPDFHLTILNNLALNNQKIGEYITAENLFDQALELSKKIFGKNYPKNKSILNNLAFLNIVNSNYLKAVYYINLAQDNILDNIFKVLFSLSENEKEIFLMKIDNDYNFYKSFYSQYYLLSNKVATELYNFEILYKKIILNSTIQNRFFFERSTDTLIKSKYLEWIQYKNVLGKEYNKPINNQRSDIEDLEQKVNDLDSKLSRLSSSYNQINVVQKARCEDVRKSLQSGETAIEFSHFRYHNQKNLTDSIMYLALVLRPQDSIPVMVRLCEQKQLDSIFARTSQSESRHINGIYKNKRLYELVWKPIEPYLQKGDNIYFSPSGLLNQVSFSAIEKNDSTYLSDDYVLNQLSSTALLTTRNNKEEPIKNLVVFGGINFEASDQEIASVLTSVPKGEEFVSRSLYVEDSTRSGKWTYLPGTLDEANNIRTIADQNGVPAKLYTGNEAVEEQFKNLNNTNAPSVLHIATHGFFFPDPESNLKKLDLMPFQEQNQFTVADNPLNRAGLLFAGSNKAWVGDSISTTREDGILTAYEASNINLTNTQLVVLSACETGLGTIKGSEGVYGLQRAFRQAGVKYLLMSLWKVPDAETKEFMTGFYTEYLEKGVTIRKAYNSTQQKMKKKYRNFPNKWAGFMLME